MADKMNLTPVEESKQTALLCARAAIEKKSTNTSIFHVGTMGAFTEFFVISSGSSERQVQAMADETLKLLRAAGHKPRVEGYDQGRWILIDTGDVVSHLFHEDIRGFYNLEELWKLAPTVAIPHEYYTSTPNPSKMPRAPQFQTYSQAMR